MYLKTKTLKTTTLVLVLFLFQAPVADAGFFSRCNSTVKTTARPAWKKNGYVKPGYYIGIGLAEKQKNDKKQRRLSEEDALNTLSRNISVEVKSSYLREISSSKEYREEVEKRVDFTTDTRSKELLRDVRVNQKWLDKKACVVWTLAVVSKKSVAAAKKEMLMKERLSLLKELLKGSDSDRYKNKNLYEKEKYWQETESLLLDIDFTLLQAEKGREYYFTRLKNEKEKVRGEIGNLEKEMNGRFSRLEILIKGPAGGADGMDLYQKAAFWEETKSFLNKTDFMYVTVPSKKSKKYYRDLIKRKLAYILGKKNDQEMLMDGKFEKMKAVLRGSLPGFKNLSVSEKLQKFKKGRKLLYEIDFTYVTGENSREPYAAEFDKRIKNLNKNVESTRGKTLILAAKLPDGFAGKLKGSLLDHIQSGFKKSKTYNGNCTGIDTCIRDARREGYARVVLVSITQNKKAGSLGAVKATLKVTYTLQNLEGTMRISAPVTAFAQVVGWDNEDINWAAAVKKIIKSKKLIFSGK